MTQEQLKQHQDAQSLQGKAGELFAFAYERNRLPEFLHGNIVHFDEQQVAMGYDILSFESPTSILPDRYIEVKTFRGHPHFYWTENEIAAARKYENHYYLYLVDMDRVGEHGYEPTIIPNPSVLFREDSQWTFKVQQYVFSLLSNEQIPPDWDTSTILLGCYKNDEHLRWILSHRVYNVRAEKNFPGAVSLSNRQVQQATYLILYSLDNPLVYMLYSMDARPYKATRKEMQVLGYHAPHALSYILHPLRERLDTFHIDIKPLLREVNHQGDNTYGTPLYLTGIQLRRYMRDKSTGPSPIIGELSKVMGYLSSAYSLWTTEQETELIRLFEAHVCFDDIARQFHRSRKAIIRRLRKLGKIPNHR